MFTSSRYPALGEVPKALSSFEKVGKPQAVSPLYVIQPLQSSNGAPYLAAIARWPLHHLNAILAGRAIPTDGGEEDGAHYLLLSLMPGQDTQALARDLAQAPPPLMTVQDAFYTGQADQDLAFALIAHLAPMVNSPQLPLRALTPASLRLSAQKTIFTTPDSQAPLPALYQAPEGPSSATAGSWTLGALVVECLTGQRPVDGSPPQAWRDLIAQCPSTWDPLCRGLLQQDPAYRWQGSQALRWLQTLKGGAIPTAAPAAQAGPAPAPEPTPAPTQEPAEVQEVAKPAIAAKPKPAPKAAPKRPPIANPIGGPTTKRTSSALPDLEPTETVAHAPPTQNAGTPATDSPESPQDLTLDAFEAQWSKTKTAWGSFVALTAVALWTVASPLLGGWGRIPQMLQEHDHMKMSLAIWVITACGLIVPGIMVILADRSLLKRMSINKKPDEIPKAIVKQNKWNWKTFSFIEALAGAGALSAILGASIASVNDVAAFRLLTTLYNVILFLAKPIQILTSDPSPAALILLALFWRLVATRGAKMALVRSFAAMRAHHQTWGYQAPKQDEVMHNSTALLLMFVPIWLLIFYLRAYVF